MATTPPSPRGHLFAMAALVMLGASVGTFARAVLDGAVTTPPDRWPWPTFVINVSGSFLLGGLLTAIARRGDDSGWRRRVRLGVGSGLLGGFTTYSTFILEIDELVSSGRLWIGAAYTVVSIVGGILAAGAGVLLADRSVPAKEDE